MWGCPRVPTPSSILLSQLPPTEHLPVYLALGKNHSHKPHPGPPGPAHMPPPLTFQMSCPLAWVFPSTLPTSCFSSKKTLLRGLPAPHTTQPHSSHGNKNASSDLTSW